MSRSSLTNEQILIDSWNDFKQKDLAPLEVFYLCNFDFDLPHMNFDLSIGTFHVKSTRGSNLKSLFSFLYFFLVEDESV